MTAATTSSCSSRKCRNCSRVAWLLIVERCSGYSSEAAELLQRVPGRLLSRAHASLPSGADSGRLPAVIDSA
ncbi:hypothetical protein PMAYCL1PPCAC_10991, partial [Pristionchus mayeri]